MFKKREQEPQAPRLQGEDFDVFPDLGDRKKPAAIEEEPVDDTPVEPTEFEKKIAAIPEEKWKKYQIIGGILLGILSGLSIAVLGKTETFGNISLIVAAVLALVIPNLFEKKSGRKMPTMRIALILSLAICLGLYMFYGFVLNPGFFKTPA